MKKLILCDLDTAENNYNYDCNSWDYCPDYEDPCQNCCHRCHKEIEIPDTEGKQQNDMNTEDKEIQELLDKAKELIKTSDKTLAEMDDMRKCIDFALNEWKTNKRWFREEPGRVTTEDVIKMCVQYGWASRGNFEYMYNKKMNEQNDEPSQNS